MDTCRYTKQVAEREYKAREGFQTIPTPQQTNCLVELNSYPHLVAQVGPHSAIGDSDGRRDSSQDERHTWGLGQTSWW